MRTKQNTPTAAAAQGIQKGTDSMNSRMVENMRQWGTENSFLCAGCEKESEHMGGTVRSPSMPPIFQGLGVCHTCADRMRRSPAYRKQLEAKSETLARRSVLTRLADSLNVDANVLMAAFGTAYENGSRKGAGAQVETALGLLPGSVRQALVYVMGVRQ